MPVVGWLPQFIKLFHGSYRQHEIGLIFFHVDSAEADPDKLDTKVFLGLACPVK